MKLTFYFTLFCLLFSCGYEAIKNDDTLNMVLSDEIKVTDSIINKTTMTKPLDEVMGKFDPVQHKDYVIIENKYSDRSGLYMHNKAYQSFTKMWEKANAEGIKLVIRSATRNFDYQKGIWERKWNKINNVVKDSGVPKTNEDVASEILEYSSMPSTSRHHWGTDIDLNSFENSYFEHGEGLHVYNWLKKNASSYGFCQPYTAKGDHRPHGYNEEKWHWSYLPVANEFYETAKTSLKNNMIEGFSGAEVAEKLNVVEHFVLGIDPSCK